MIYLIVALRLGVAGLFIGTGIIKVFIDSPLVFADQIAAYEILPDELVLPIAFFLPWFEIVVGAASLNHQSAPSMLRMMLGMMAVFSLAVASALLRGLDISCGCFGAEASSPVSWWKVIQNIAIMAVLFFLIKRKSHRLFQ